MFKHISTTSLLLCMFSNSCFASTPEYSYEELPNGGCKKTYIASGEVSFFNHIPCSELLTPIILRFSDQRLKNDIEHLRVSSEQLDNLHPYTFTWKGSNRDSIGFIAQDLERVDSRLVVQGEEGAPCTVEDKRGCKRIDLAGIIAILTAEVKTLRAEVNALKSDQRVGY